MLFTHHFFRLRFLSSSGEASPPPEPEDEPLPPPVVVVEKNPSLHVVSIGLNRPEKRNCVNEETAAALAEAFLDFEQDEEMRCAVLHGFGGNFCAGYDLEELSRLTDEERPNRLASMLERGPMVRDAVQYFFANYCTIVCHRLFSDLVPGGHMGPVTEGRFIIWRALRYLKIRISSLFTTKISAM